MTKNKNRNISVEPQDTFDLFRANLDRGDFLFSGKIFPEAEFFYEQAYLINPTSPEALFKLGTLYYQIKDDEKALQYLNIADRIDPKNPTILNNLGAALGRSGNIKESIKAFKQVSEIMPDHGAAAFNCGRLYLTIGKAKEAEEWLLKASKCRPDHEETINLLEKARDLIKHNNDKEL